MYSIIYYPALIAGALIAIDALLFAISYATSSSLFSFWARVLSAYLSLILCAIYGVIASIALRIVGKHRLAQWTTAKSFKWTMRFTTGVKFDIVEGEEYLNSTRPLVLIGNHQTELDILFLGAIWPQYCSVTAKKSLKHMPFLGWFMALSGTVFLDRAKREQAVKAFEGAAKEMKEHRQSVFIFPEGTRSYAKDPVLLPFKKGAFHLAVQAGVPIVPVVAENYSRVLHIQDRRFEPGVIRVKVLPPIPTKDLTSADVDNLVKHTRERMLKTLQDMSTDRESKAVQPVASTSTVDGVVKATGTDVKQEL